MINVDDTTKEAYLADSVPKQITIEFPNANITYHNDDIVGESLEIEECINDGTELTFEGCVASKMKFKCDSPVRDLRGEYVEVSILADGTAEDITLFTGYIDEQTNRTQEDVITEFTAYDKLYVIGQQDITSWYNGLTFPISIRNFRNSLFTQIGIIQEDITLINDSLNMQKIDTKDQILVIDVLKAICQANARFGQIGRDGKFYYRKLTEITKALYPSTETYPSEETFPSAENAAIVYDYSDYIKVTYEPFKTEKITSVAVIGRDGSNTTYGSGTNTLYLTDNIVAQGCVNKSLMAETIYNEIYRIEYIPSNVEAKGLPWAECGDIYMFNTRKNLVRAYVLHRVLKGIQALYDDITADGSQMREPYTESSYTQSTVRELDIQDNTLKIGVLRADLIETNQIVATKATIAQLNATNARVGSLEADHVSVAQLAAVNAAVVNLAAIAITTQNLSAQNISANQITTGTLSVNRMDVNTLASSSFSTYTMKVAGLEITGGSHFSQCRLSGATAMVETTGGHTVKVPLCV